MNGKNDNFLNSNPFIDTSSKWSISTEDDYYDEFTDVVDYGDDDEYYNDLTDSDDLEEFS